MTARPTNSTRVLAWSVWLVAGVVPVALLASSLDAPSSLWHWVRFNAGALRDTGLIAASGGLIAGCAGVCVASCVASEHAWTRRIGTIAGGVGIFGFVLPGVLVGAAIVRLDLEPWIASVTASAARSMILGSAAGLIVGGSEPADARAMRTLDRAGDALGWVRVAPGRAATLFAGVWLGASLLGLHEIEASVLVRPPGTGNLPQQMLSDLHYARLEQLAAGGVCMGVLGLTLGALAAWTLSGRVRRNGRTPRSVS